MAIWLPLLLGAGVIGVLALSRREAPKALPPPPPPVPPPAPPNPLPPPPVPIPPIPNLPNLPPLPPPPIPINPGLLARVGNTVVIPAPDPDPNSRAPYGPGFPTVVFAFMPGTTVTHLLVRVTEANATQLKGILVGYRAQGLQTGDQALQPQFQSVTPFFGRQHVVEILS